MFITFITSTAYLDTTLPLINEMSKFSEINLLINYSDNIARTSIVDIQRVYNKNKILNNAEKFLGNCINILDNPEKIKISFIYWKTWKIISLKNWLFIQKLKKLFTGSDVIYIQSLNLFYLITLLLMHKNKIIVDYHDPIEHSSSKEKLSLKLIKKKYNKIANKIILHNNTNIEDFSKINNIDRAKIQHIKFGAIPVKKIERDLNIKFEEKHTILFFGRISPYKGIEYLVKAVEILKEKYTDIKLLIAGAGDMYFDISGIKNDKHYEIYNEYISNEKLAEFMQRASFVVCPYTDATQSGVVMTAYEFNKPVIASDVGSFREYIKDGETGMIVPPKEPEELASAIEKLFNDEKLLKRMKDKIEIFKKTELSWEKAAKEIINTINEIIR